MRLKFFWIPYLEFAPAEEELNRFLAQHRVVHVERHFCPQPPGWTLCVEWLTGTQGGEGPVPSGNEKAAKVDYREVLDEPTFLVFAALRTWRKERANADGVPLYTVATNEQLAAIASQRVQTAGALQKIDGFGASRMGKYAGELLTVCQKEMGAPLKEGASPS